MSKPQWLREAEAEHGMRVRAGTETQAEAADAIAALMIAEHRDYLAGVASKGVGDWVRKHESPDLFQDHLFPLLPAYLDVAPRIPFRVADMTISELEAARVMVMTRTGNVMRGARRHRKVFTDFYNQVKPMLKDHPALTVAEVTPKLTSQREPARGAA